MGVKLSQITSGNQINSDTDSLVAVRSDNENEDEDVLVNLPSLLDDFGSSSTKPFVIVGSGQSNMVGAASAAESNFTVLSNIYIWNGTAWIIANYSAAPLNNTVSGSPLVACANEWRSSGRIPASRPIYLILNAQGGLPIENWTQPSPGYSPNMWTDITTQLNASGVDHIDHVMWMQGEANADFASSPLANSYATYAAQFTTLIGLYQALSQWTTTTTFSVSEIGEWPANQENDRNDFLRSVNSYFSSPYITWVSSTGCVNTSNNTGPNHFSGQSLYTMGQRHCHAMAAMKAGIGSGSNKFSQYGYSLGAPTWGNSYTAITGNQVAAATVNNGGTGGTNGTTQVVTGTTGTGTKFQACVTISGGTITAVNNIITGGLYTVNPTSLTGEPVTGSGLTGATLNLQMGYSISPDEIRNGGYFLLQNTIPVTVVLPRSQSLEPAVVPILIDVTYPFTISGQTVTLATQQGASTINLRNGTSPATSVSISSITMGNAGVLEFKNFGTVWEMTGGGSPIVGNVVKGYNSFGGLSTDAFNNMHYSVTASGNSNNPSGYKGGVATFLNRSNAASPNTITMNQATAAVNGANTQVLSPGTGYAPGDTSTVSGGTGTAAVIPIVSTQVVSATVNAGGSGGTNGTQTVTGTTGTGTKFQASVTVAGGAITAVLGITVPGAYTVNPTLTGQPVTGAGLTGATLNVVMGVLTIGTSSYGSYSALPPFPSTQGSTSGSGTGLILDLYFNGVYRRNNPKNQTVATSLTQANEYVQMHGTGNDVWVDSMVTRLPNGISTALSSSNLTQNQLTSNAIYSVNSGAALVLEYALAVALGKTIFLADQGGSFTITTKGNDTLYINGIVLTAGMLLTIPAGSFIEVCPFTGKNEWMGSSAVCAFPSTSVNGSTSGSAVFNQTQSGTSKKEVIIYCNALLGTATYTFPTPFTYTPEVLSQSLAAIVSSISTTSVTLTGTTSTGFITLNGF